MKAARKGELSKPSRPTEQLTKLVSERVAELSPHARTFVDVGFSSGLRHGRVWDRRWKGDCRARSAKYEVRDEVCGDETGEGGVRRRPSRRGALEADFNIPTRLLIFCHHRYPTTLVRAPYRGLGAQDSSFASALRHYRFRACVFLSCRIYLRPHGTLFEYYLTALPVR